MNQSFIGYRISFLFLLAFFVCVTNGCGARKYQLVTIKGQVKYKGEPLKYGDIAFHPKKTTKEGVPHRIGMGKIDAQGNYSISTFKKDDGIMPGEYAVVMMYVEKRKPSDPEDVSPPSIIPEKYCHVDHTTLKATVPDNVAGPITFDFEIPEK